MSREGAPPAFTYKAPRSGTLARMTQPREPNGQFGEKLNVGVARRLTETLRAALGHDGTDDGDLAARLAAQEAVLAAVDVVPAEPATLAPVAVKADPLAEEVEVAGQTVRDLAGVAVALDVDEVKAAELVVTAKVPGASMAIIAEALDRLASPEEEKAEEGEVEEKARWDPHKHPRDAEGQWSGISGGGYRRPTEAARPELLRKPDKPKPGRGSEDDEVAATVARTVDRDTAALEAFRRSRPKEPQPDLLREARTERLRSLSGTEKPRGQKEPPKGERMMLLNMSDQDLDRSRTYLEGLERQGSEPVSGISPPPLKDTRQKLERVKAEIARRQKDAARPVDSSTARGRVDPAKVGPGDVVLFGGNRYVVTDSSKSPPRRGPGQVLSARKVNDDGSAGPPITALYKPEQFVSHVGTWKGEVPRKGKNVAPRPPKENPHAAADRRADVAMQVRAAERRGKAWELDMESKAVVIAALDALDRAADGEEEPEVKTEDLSELVPEPEPEADETSDDVENPGTDHEAEDVPEPEAAGYLPESEEEQTEEEPEVEVEEEKAEGGPDKNRGNAENLRRYWTHGEGASKIRWGTPGDHMRCVRQLVEHGKFRTDQAHGYCNLREKEATGSYPAQHAEAVSAKKVIHWLDGLVEVKAEATDLPNENPEPDGVMVALYPPDHIAQALAVDGGLDAAQLHVTLAYLGRVPDVEGRVDDLVQLVAGFTDDSYDLAGEVNGLGRFSSVEDSRDALVALVDAPDLPDFRTDMVDALEDAGFEVRADHGFSPHMTLAFIEPTASLPLERIEPVPATFGTLSLAYGGEVWDFPLHIDDDAGVEGARRHDQQVGEGDAAYDKTPAPTS